MEREARRPVRVSHQLQEIFDSMDGAGFFALIRENRSRGLTTLLTHLKMEHARTGDERYRNAHDWIVKHRDQFLWGVQDGFVAG